MRGCVDVLIPALPASDFGLWTSDFGLSSAGLSARKSSRTCTSTRGLTFSPLSAATLCLSSWQ